MLVTGHDRPLLDGVTIDRPFDAVPTFLTNVVERITGERDERTGRALTHLALAGQHIVVAGLRSGSRVGGVIGTGSTALGTALPMLGIATGAVQVWNGWQEIERRGGDATDLIQSRTARTGLLQIGAGALLFVPGVGAALAGAAMRAVAAANEMNAFSALDHSTQAG